MRIAFIYDVLLYDGIGRVFINYLCNKSNNNQRIVIIVKDILTDLLAF